MVTNRRIAPHTFALLTALAVASARPCVANAQRYVRYYSGTITWTDRWQISSSIANGSGGETVSVTIDSGAALSAVPGPTRVTCSGKGSSTVTHSNAGTTSSEYTVSGSGLIDIVTTPDGESPRSGTYMIRVACGSDGEPARFDGGVGIVINRQDASTPDLALLAGTETTESPMTDEANNVTGTLSITWRLRSGPSVLKAVPGGPYTAVRGEAVSLDGSASEGDDLRYTWTFAPRGCPAGARGNAAARKDGPSPSVTLLCSATATLTVTDGRATDRKTVEVTVRPRDWKTPFSHSPQEGVLEDGRAPVITGIGTSGNPETGSVSVNGGRNVCAVDPSAELHVFHPAAVENSWDRNGYELQQVSDPGGPFDGYWFVASYSLRVERQTLLNRYLVPTGPVLFDTKSFYQANRDLGNQVESYLAAIRGHEGMGSGRALGHSGLMKQSLAQRDPAAKVEALFAPQTRSTLVSLADAEIRRAELAICNAAKDPLPEGWRGRLAYIRDDTKQWHTMVNPAIVGGPTDQTSGACG